MSSAYKVTTPVSTEPITLTDAKAWLRVDFSDDDTLITNLISRVRALAETITHRALATQTIQQLFTIERPVGGELSGTIDPGPNWYHYQEQLGGNPFGASQFYFDLAMPPVQTVSLVETKVTPFEDWVTFTGTTYLDTTSEPARMYFQVPVTANFWRFTFTAGYVTGYTIPSDLLEALYEGISFFYQFREAQELPQSLLNKLLARRVDWV